MFVVSDMEETRHNNQTKQDAESAKEKKPLTSTLVSASQTSQVWVCIMDNIIDLGCTPFEQFKSGFCDPKFDFSFH